MIRVNECCCGCSLRTGSLIVLWLEVIVAIYSIASAVTLPKNYETVDLLLNPPYNRVLKTMLLIKVAFGIVGFITSSFGIIGIQNNRAKYLTPYLYYVTATVVYNILIVLLSIIIPELKMPNDYELSIEIGLLAIGLVLEIYLLIVVKSCRDSMLEEAAANNETAIPCVNAPPPYPQAYVEMARVRKV